VFSGEFVDDLIKPQEVSDFHFYGVFGTSTQSVFARALSLPLLSTETTS
jgi:hypothetical protein